MPDKEKGSGKWISSTHGGSGVAHEGEHDPNCSGVHSINGYCVPEPGKPQRGEKEKARINRNASEIRSVLKGHALSTAGACRNGALDDEDRAELIESLDKDLASMPKKLRPKLREAGERILNFVAEGDRLSAWRLADETAISTALDMPVTWTPPDDDVSPEDLIKDIPR